MKTVIINLASDKNRWDSVSQRFLEIGLKPIRQEAVLGRALSLKEIEEIYSAALNCKQYYKPLLSGEIGCYASHINVWRKFKESNENAIAIFEDDINVSDDLPEVLEKISHISPGWDMIKLIGRTPEKIRTRFDFKNQRDLISYWRIPSHTGAYVLSREGAKKILTHRLPFGRPIDVDLRHWWECQLDIKGIYPYPAQHALTSQISSINIDQKPHSLISQMRKAAFLMRYSVLNWHSNNRAAC